MTGRIKEANLCPMFYITPDGKRFFDLIESYLSPAEVGLVRQAFEFACQEHGDQRRKSGEPYFTHPLTVAYYLAQYQLDAPALIAALLHDVAEDTRVSVSQIEAAYGQDVAQIVDGVTKFETTAEAQAAYGEMSAEQKANATLNKLFRFMTRDVRVVLIKLFDRLHNMQTLKVMPRDKQEKTATETIYVYAPLAYRLGLWRLKHELQQVALSILDYNAYVHIKEELDQLVQDQKPLLDVTIPQICRALETAQIPYIQVLPSPRNIYSIYENLWINGRTRYHVDRTLRLVITLRDRLACYTAMGAMHALWQPVPDQFDDYIARPRENLYRALHTTVLHPNGFPIKLRFRTEAMNIVSEIGILARWARSGASVSPELAQEVAEQVNALLADISQNVQGDPHESTDGVRTVVEDVLTRQITVYTPRGEPKKLPVGATPIDFAYKIHTEVGHTCRSARVNGVPVPLNTVLKDGDRVEILRHRAPNPRRIWLEKDLGYLRSTYAENHVRRWFRRLTPEAAMEVGQQLLQEELQMIGLPDYSHDEAAAWMGYKHHLELYRALGEALTLPTMVSTRVLTRIWNKGELRRVGTQVQAENGQQFIIMNAGKRPVKLCRSCHPQPGDTIFGFIRKIGGVTVHREGCSFIEHASRGNRILGLRWGQDEISQVRLVTIKIDVFDRPNLVYEIATLLHQEMINIQTINTPVSTDERSIRLGLDIASPRQLVRVVHRIHALVNVQAVTCHLGALPTPAV